MISMLQEVLDGIETIEPFPTTAVRVFEASSPATRIRWRSR